MNLGRTDGDKVRRFMLDGMALPVLVVVGLIIFFSLGSEAFLTLRNLTAISGQASALLIACLGATLVILMGEFTQTESVNLESPINHDPDTNRHRTSAATY